MDIWVVSTLGLLWIMLLWTAEYKFLCRHMLSFILIRYLEVELLGLTATLRLTFWETAALFPKWPHHFAFPISTVWGIPISPHSHWQVLFSVILITDILVWCGILLWFWCAFSLWLVRLSIFSWAYWSFVYLLWRNSYSNPLPIFWLGCLVFFDIELYELFVYFGN